jgi:hypothetical protein
MIASILYTELGATRLVHGCVMLLAICGQGIHFPNSVSTWESGVDSPHLDTMRKSLMGESQRPFKARQNQSSLTSEQIDLK